MARFAPLKHQQASDWHKTNEYQHGFSFSTKDYALITSPGINSQIVKLISHHKDEPSWMTKKRLAALRNFESMSLPNWGADLSHINFDEIHYYLRPLSQASQNWEDVPADIKTTFERIGVPQAEREYLAGVKMQYDSEIVYGSLKKQWLKDGVIFLSMDEGLKQHSDLVQQYFGSVIPSQDNKFAALNSAAWSGGSFVYVPPGVHVTMPLQTYFRINASQAGQFERTLIIVDEGASVHYIEGCTAPAYSTESLHAAVVEIIVKKGARCQYTTIQNWYKTVYNLVTKRARVEAEGEMIWTDFNMGSKVTMKYPSFILAGAGAKGETLSMAVAGEGQHQDTGGKAIHLAPHTKSTIVSKSISKNGGRASYRGSVFVGPNAHQTKNKVICDALILDPDSRSDTYPVEKVFCHDITLEHEATVSKIGEEQLFYLMSRGLSEQEASKLIVQGFVAPFVRQLPLEYAVEMNRLIDYEMEGSVG